MIVPTNTILPALFVIRTATVPVTALAAFTGATVTAKLPLLSTPGVAESFVNAFSTSTLPYVVLEPSVIVIGEASLNLTVLNVLSNVNPLILTQE